MIQAELEARGFELKLEFRALDHRNGDEDRITRLKRRAIRFAEQRITGDLKAQKLLARVRRVDALIVEMQLAAIPDFSPEAVSQGYQGRSRHVLLHDVELGVRH